MCGISGIIYKRKDRRYDIFSMMDVQKHRGPDDEGAVDFAWNGDIRVKDRNMNNYDVVPSGSIGFNRLSIRDISMNGHQPMISDDGKTVLAFNGEIYNTAELYPLVDNYAFKGKSDTELLLALYLKLGFVDMIKRLDGMFAICLVDINAGKLYISRDRLGIKPLYYYENDNVLCIASEIKGIIASKSYQCKVNTDSLYEYFLFRNNTNNKTLFEHVYLYEPGCVYEYNCNLEKSITKYFDINDYTRGKTGYRRTKQDMIHTISNAVKLQTVSDVPVGTQLSGGIDSSIVAHELSKVSKKPMDSESIVFYEKSLSEEKYIDYVAEKETLKANKYFFTEGDFAELFEKTIWHFESILVHPNCMGLYKLCANAKNNVSVLLSGEGADELFGGYKQYEQVTLMHKCGIDIDKIRDYSVKHAIGVSETLLVDLFGKSKTKDLCDIRYKLFDSFTGDPRDKQVKYEIKTYLPELLIRQDKMSMANSIENRVPLLDNLIIDRAMQVPFKYLVKTKWNLLKYQREAIGKYLLKDYAKDVFGKEFAYREKVGFAMPIKKIMASDMFKNYYNRVVRSKITSREYFNGKLINNMMDDFYNLSNEGIEVLWKAVSFEVWCQLFVDGRGVGEIER